MKLVDILARELKVWPEGVRAITQGGGSGVLRDESFREIQPSTYLMIADDSGDPTVKRNGNLSSSVTRAQWQAAVDALKAEVHPAESMALHHQEVGRITRQWNGEGLPPVGVDVQMSHGIAQVTSYSPDNKWAFLWVAESNLPSLIKIDNPAMFRPIRTPDQIAAEQRNLSIGEMREIWNFSASSGADPFIALYAAGYRKFEIVDN
jgi:hypothetical protein